MVGTLLRTTTSGPGKAAQVLPVFVSDKAGLKKPWLYDGLVLLLYGERAFRWAHFLPLPLPSLAAPDPHKAGRQSWRFLEKGMLAVYV